MAVIRMSSRAIGVLVVALLVVSACRAAPTAIAVPDSAATATGTPVEAAPAEPTASPSAAVATPAPDLSPEPVAEPIVLPDRFETPASWADQLVGDPDVVDGTLDNGLHYLIRRNTSPGGQAQLRLVVEAGSLADSESAPGTAHFLEHMMFNGTERFAGNEILAALESFGSAFGADVNAYTSWQETVYELTLPSRADSLDLGLEVLAQWASAPTLAPDDIDAERGVIREEQRLVLESPAGRISPLIREALLIDTEIPDHEPVGTVEGTESMTEAELRAYFEQWYRPELMHVVAVGDFDTGDVERRIEELFGAIVGSSELQSPIRIDASGPLVEPVYDVLTDPEITRSEIEIYFRSDATPRASLDAFRQLAVRQLAALLIGERLSERVRSGQSPFLGASPSSSMLTRSFALDGVTATVEPDNVEPALVALVTMLEQARQHGFSDAEFDRALDQMRAVNEQGFAESDTIQDVDIADALVAAVLEGEPLLEPTIAYELSLEVLETLRAADAQLFINDLLDTNPYVLAIGPDSEADQLPQPERLAALYNETLHAAVEAPTSAGDELVRLIDAPAPAVIVTETSLDGLDTSVFELDNGARVALRHSAVTENRVFVRVVSEGGFFAVDDQQVSLLGFITPVILNSGFGAIDPISLDRYLSGRVVELDGSIGRTHERLFGEASADDLETLFQLIHLAMTDATIDPVSLRQFEAAWRPLVANPTANPALAADLELWQLRYGDSPWFRRAPTVADLDALDPERLLALWRDRFADASDFDFIVVGDFEDDETLDLAQRYFGTLPSSGSGDEQTTARDPGLPQENLVATVTAGVGEQGRVTFNWESPYPATLEAEVAARALELVVNARLRDRVREQLGASYAPRAAVSLQDLPVPWIDTSIDIEAEPERIGEVSDAVRDELAKLRAGDIDVGYLDRAIDQLSENWRFFGNDDWIDLIEFHLANPDRSSAEFRERIAIAGRLDLADLATAAQAAFPESRSVEVRVVPG